MIRSVLFTAFLWLLAASPAQAHEPHACRATYQPIYQGFPSSCRAVRSPFRLTCFRNSGIPGTRT